VTVVDRSQRLMPREDQDVCEALRNLLEDEDIEIYVNPRIRRFSGKSGSR